MGETIALPYRPRAGQKALHDMAASARFVVCICHRGWGKTMAAVNEALFAILLSGLPRPQAAYVCPYRSQAKAVAWDAAKAMTAAIPNVSYNETELRIDLSPEL